ncbi:hypothetical protein BYT27DRAFT_7159005 [Phlegmacium glaucopus]|nr:hypothetical protein BYT27DRAFT_7159005 [Phlegmacium glaucopus]
MSIEDSSCHIDKGKRREQEPTERSPLLGSSSRAIEDFHTILPSTSHRRLRSKLTTVFLVSLSVCIMLFVIVALFAWSYASKASHLTPEHIINHDFVFVGPNRVDILNITNDGGIWLNVRGQMGLDAGSAIGIGSDPEDDLFKDLWKSIGRWGVRRLERVSVHLSTITVLPEHDPHSILLTVDIPPIELPLTVDPPRDTSWLTHISMPIHFKLTTNTTLLFEFLKYSWLHGSLAVSANVGQASIRGGSLNLDSWRSVFYGKLTNIWTSIHMKLPMFSGFPHPGHNVPFPSASDLITLKSFDVFSNSNTLALQATASVVNPAPPSFNLTVPSLPFTISIPDKRDNTPISVASVSTSPFGLTHPNITLFIAGGILPIPSSSFPTLSQFVTRYLSSEDNTVIVSTHLFPNLSVEAKFPAPNPRPRLLRNVTIKDMSIRPSNSAFLASGVVHAHIVLPKGFTVGMEVFKVLPDVIIFDGEVPPSYNNQGKWGDDDMDDLPPEMPLPDPLPERAFGHIRPKDWLPSVSEPIELEEEEGLAYAVSAKVVDVPLEVLPGREGEFSSFVGKVIFGSGGAVAGILGTAAVTVAVDGLPLHTPGRKAGEIALSGLPFQGRLLVGKNSFFSGELLGLKNILDDWAGR